MTIKASHCYDWSEIAFASKKPLKDAALFILAPRHVSKKKLQELLKQYLPKGNVVLGIAKEPYVLGFEGQAHFRTLQEADVTGLARKIAASSHPHKLYVLKYFTQETDVIIEKLKPAQVCVVRGSYLHVFHSRSTFYVLGALGIGFFYASPFADEAEAHAYENQNEVRVDPVKNGDEVKMLDYARDVARQSYDYSFQTGCVLARSGSQGYQPLATGFNRVIPYQTYALLHGNARETHHAAHQDTSHYDTIHAEMDMLVYAAAKGIKLAGMSLFINLMPCPSCARTFSQTGLLEVVYELDHSDGYAARIFEQCGIKTRRIIR